MEVIIAIANISVLAFLTYHLYIRSISLQKFFWPALLIKLLAGIALGLLYTYYYTKGDTFLFFEDGVTLATLARENISSYLNFIWAGNNTYPVWSTLNFAQPRAMFLSKIVSVFCLVSANNYWIVSLYFSFISFVCSWALVKTIIRYFPETKYAAIASFLFIPTVIFWGSGVLKESLAIASLFFLSHVFLIIWFKDKVTLINALLSLFFFWILWQLKYYYAAVFIPVIVTSLLVKYIISAVPQLHSLKIKILVWLIVFIVPLFLISLLKENFHPDLFLNVIVKNYNLFQKLSAPGEAIRFMNLNANAWSILYNSPWALVSCLFRPFIWEANNTLQLLVALENIMLLLLIITSLRNWRTAFISKNRLLLLSLVVYVLVLSIFLALSTPNFGTLSRYRIGFLPYLFFVVSIHNPIIGYITKSLQK